MTMSIYKHNAFLPQLNELHSVTFTSFRFKTCNQTICFIFKINTLFTAKLDTKTLRLDAILLLRNQRDFTGSGIFLLRPGKGAKTKASPPRLHPFLGGIKSPPPGTQGIALDKRGCVS